MSATAVERQGLTVDGLRIAYESAGDGPGVPVVLIPGGFENRTYYSTVASHLAKTRRVLSVDLRGQGESDTPTAISLADWEADVTAVATAAAPAGAVLCGHSASGAVALAVAATHPELVRGVVMLDGGVLFAPAAVHEQIATTMVPALAGPDWLAALKGFFERTFDTHDPIGIHERVMADIDRMRPEIARGLFADLYGEGSQARRELHSKYLAEVECPVLYVHAKVPADLARLQELRPALMLGQVVGSGHYVMLSAAEQLNAMLDRFLEIVDQTPAQ